MKKVPLVQAVDKVVALKMRAVDRIVEDLVEPLSDIGNPEKLIGKRFESWDENDLALLTRIYGSGESTPLADLAFKRIYEQVRQLEEAEL